MKYNYIRWENKNKILGFSRLTLEQIKVIKNMDGHSYLSEEHYYCSGKQELLTIININSPNIGSAKILRLLEQWTCDSTGSFQHATLINGEINQEEY